MFRKAINAGSGKERVLFILAQLVASWGWTQEAEQVWWGLADRPDVGLDALKRLFAHYTKTRNSAGLRRVSKTAMDRDPNDLIARNNYAMLSLLSDNAIADAARIAADLRAAQPENPAFLSTYARSLYKTGDPAGALAALERLPESLLRDPALAPYMALFLAANGRSTDAARYIPLIRWERLFPEEIALFQALRPARP